MDSLTVRFEGLRIVSMCRGITTHEPIEIQ